MVYWMHKVIVLKKKTWDVTPPIINVKDSISCLKHSTSYVNSYIVTMKKTKQTQMIMSAHFMVVKYDVGVMTSPG